MEGSGDSSSLVLGVYTGPPSSAPTCSIPEVPSANTLAQRIINSTANYFSFHKGLEAQLMILVNVGLSMLPLQCPCLPSSDTHLMCHSDTSEAYAKCHKLFPFHCFVNLTHLDTYIHGPFKFATICGQKFRDQICQKNWDILWSRPARFTT